MSTVSARFFCVMAHMYTCTHTTSELCDILDRREGRHCGSPQTRRRFQKRPAFHPTNTDIPRCTVLQQPASHPKRNVHRALARGLDRRQLHIETLQIHHPAVPQTHSGVCNCGRVLSACMSWRRRHPPAKQCSTAEGHQSRRRSGV